MPGELLSDDSLGLHGLAHAMDDPTEADTAAGEIRSRFTIREQARQAAMAQTSKEAIQRASKASTHQSRQWAPGQWVYVFRRAKANQELRLKNCWVGPGVVILMAVQAVPPGLLPSMQGLEKNHACRALRLLLDFLLPKRHQGHPP